MRRRTILTLTGVAMAPLAGCSTDETADGNGNGGTGSEDGDGTSDSGGESNIYPDGFDENGVADFDRAFGTESAFYGADSFRYEIALEEDPASPEYYTTESEGWVSGHEELSYYDGSYSGRGENPAGSFGFLRREQDYTSSTATVRQTSESSDGEDPSYEMIDQTFEKESEYFISLFRRMENISFESETTEVDTADGTADAIEYDIVDASPEGFYGEDDPREVTGALNMSMVIREDGMPVRISYQTEDVQYWDADSELEFDEGMNIEFSEYNNVEPTEPEWFADAISATDATEDMF